MTSSPGSKEGGLRERKKARTKHAIQNHALRLFREQGFAATTVEQVAEAAEVSPSTVFRYFPTKEELVVFDAFDPVIFAAFAEQPPERTLVAAWRGAVLESIAQMSPDDARHQLHRGELLLSVPELWGASLGDLKDSFAIMVNLSAERTGLPPTDQKLRATVGAIVGAMLMVAMDWVNNPSPEVFANLDQALAHLDEGLVR